MQNYVGMITFHMGTFFITGVCVLQANTSFLEKMPQSVKLYLKF